MQTPLPPGGGDHPQINYSTFSLINWSARLWKGILEISLKDGAGFWI